MLANNTWTIAVRDELAKEQHLDSLADLSRYLQRGGTFTNWPRRRSSSNGSMRCRRLKRLYHFTLQQDQLLSLAWDDIAVTIQAAAEQTS